MTDTAPTIPAASPAAVTPDVPADPGHVVLLHGVAPAVEDVVRGGFAAGEARVIRIPADADVRAAVRAHAPDVLLVQAPEEDPAAPLFPAPLSSQDEAPSPAVVVIVTGLGAARRVRDVVAGGADEVLVAPFQGGEARLRITAVCDAHRRARELDRLQRGLATKQRAMHDQNLELGALMRVTMSVASGAVLGEVFSCLAGEVMALCGCQAAHVAFREDSGHVTLVGVAATDPAVVNALGMRADIGVSATSMAIADGRPHRVDDQRAAGDGACADRLGWGATVAVPVMIAGEVWGAIGVVSATPHALRAGIRRQLARFAELASLAIGNAHTSAETRQLTLRDHLTGLYNRRAFEDALKAALAAGNRHGNPVSLLMDIDHFKRINDSHGHPAGDAVLIELSRRLRASARGDEVLARIGGEEFALLLPVADVDAAFLAGERLRAAVAAEDFPVAGAVTVSVGVAQAWDAADPAVVIQAADDALYRSKREGRNRVTAHPGTPAG